MNRESAKNTAKSGLKDYVNTKHGRNTGKLFRCLNQDHEDKKPSMSYDERRNKIRCFSGSCNVDWDIFDLIGHEYGLTDNKAKFNKTYEVLGINIDNSIETYNHQGYRFENVEDLDNKQHPLNDNNLPDQPNSEIEVTKEDLTNFFLQAKSNISDPACLAYLSKRGISEETAKRYGVGYKSDWKSPKAVSKDKNPPATPRIIIPTSQNSYLARDIRSEEVIPKYQEDFTKMKVGDVGIFNIDALTKGEPCFVVEGEFDALSFLEIGFNAVALGSTSNIASFLEKLKTLPRCSPLIVATDADKSGKAAAKKLEEGLRKLGIKYTVCNLYKDPSYNDPNDLLVADREAFKEKAQECIRSLDERLSLDAQGEVEEVILEAAEAEEKFEIEKREYLQTSASNKISDFRKNRNETRRVISTGFTKLDEVLGGGLYDALYVIGAISSLGKTTLLIQLADYLASQGHDVLYFSLEMSQYEVMAKSISRHTYWHCYDNGIPLNLSKNTREVATGENYINSIAVDFTPKEFDIVYCAEKSYEKYADKLFIHEGVGDEGAGDFGVEAVKLAVEKHKKYTGKVPIVIVDYLQILAPSNPKTTDKQNTDKAVLELKLISRRCKTPVIAISSLNRQSYKDIIGMEAFKESGAIEYSSDVLIGLELKGAGEKGFDVDKAKKQRPRDIKLKILKNRNGETGDSIEFKYYSHANLFREVPN